MSVNQALTLAEIAFHAEMKKRQADPTYSLEQSKEDYSDAVYALDDFAGSHKYAMENPVEFVRELNVKVRAIQSAFDAVLYDIQRIAESQNPGWGVGESHFRYGVRPRRVFNGRNFTTNYETASVDEDGTIVDSDD